MKNNPVLLFYCQHSVGIGHLVRSFALASEIGKYFDTYLVSGGKFPKGMKKPENIHFIQLPAVELDTRFHLKSVSKSEIKQMMKERLQKLLEILADVQPDIILTELFPFGREDFAGELIPFLKKAKQMACPPKIFSSLRDIIDPKFSTQHVMQNFCVILTKMFYDGILVHSDSDFIRFEEFVTNWEKMETTIHHTGFVTASVPLERGETQSYVLASAGGGKVGFQHLKIILQGYKEFGFGTGIGLKLITGPMIPDADWESLLEIGKGVAGLQIVKRVDKLQDELAKARASISQCGYNTTMELLNSKIPALLIPFVNSRNTEQEVRAERMEKLGLFRSLKYKDMDAKNLAKAVRETLEFTPVPNPFDMNGAENTARKLQELCLKPTAKV